MGLRLKVFCVLILSASVVLLAPQRGNAINNDPCNTGWLQCYENCLQSPGDLADCKAGCDDGQRTCKGTEQFHQCMVGNVSYYCSGDQYFYCTSQTAPETCFFCSYGDGICYPLPW